MSSGVILLQRPWISIITDPKVEITTVAAALYVIGKVFFCASAYFCCKTIHAEMAEKLQVDFLYPLVPFSHSFFKYGLI